MGWTRILKSRYFLKPVIPSDIAEGFDLETNPEFVRFLRYAKWSCTEVQSELYVALNQQFLRNAEFRMCMIMQDVPVLP